MFKKHQRKQEQQIQELYKQQRQFEIDLAYAIALEGLTGERRDKAIERIAEAEKKQAGRK